MRPDHWFLTWRCITVARRNWVFGGRTWSVGFVLPLVEPLLYAGAFGLGFRALIPEVHYGGQTLSYASFIAPGLVAMSIMYTAFFENAYGSFARIHDQKTCEVVVAAPISIEEYVAGEILSGAAKSVLAACILLAVFAPFGLLASPASLGMVPLAFLGGLCFGSIGMIFTGVVKHMDQLNLPVFLLLMPMFLFMGVFFPIDTLPGWVQTVGWALPFTHLVALARDMSLGLLTCHGALISCGYLLGLAAICFAVALITLRRRLIQ